MGIFKNEKKEESDDDGHNDDGLVEIAVNIAKGDSDVEKALEGQRDIEMSNVLITDVDSTGTKEFVLYLSDSSTTYALMPSTSPPLNSRYSSLSFHGIAIDTSCAFVSTCGVKQFKAYCKFVGCEPNIRKDDGKKVNFGVGLTRTLGYSKCSFPI